MLPECCGCSGLRSCLLQRAKAADKETSFILGQKAFAGLSRVIGEMTGSCRPYCSRAESRVARGL